VRAGSSRKGVFGCCGRPSRVRARCWAALPSSSAAETALPSPPSPSSRVAPPSAGPLSLFPRVRPARGRISFTASQPQPAPRRRRGESRLPTGQPHTGGPDTPQTGPGGNGVGERGMGMVRRSRGISGARAAGMSGDLAGTQIMRPRPSTRSRPVLLLPAPGSMPACSLRGPGHPGGRTPDHTPDTVAADRGYRRREGESSGTREIRGIQ